MSTITLEPQSWANSVNPRHLHAHTHAHTHMHTHTTTHSPLAWRLQVMGNSARETSDSHSQHLSHVNCSDVLRNCSREGVGREGKAEVPRNRGISNKANKQKHSPHTTHTHTHTHASFQPYHTLTSSLIPTCTLLIVWARKDSLVPTV